MDFSQQRNPASNFTGITVVVVLHAVLGYALLNGLGHKVVEVLKKPLDVSLIEEVKPPPPPPPPPPKTLVPPPQVAVPPPAYVPPPEVEVTPPPQPAVITATVATPPPPVEIAPPPPVKVVPQAVAVALVCPNHVEVRSRVAFPAQAQRMGLSGEVVVEFTVTPAGSITNINVIRSSHSLFNAPATQAVSQLRCNGQGQDVRVRVPFAFRLER